MRYMRSRVPNVRHTCEGFIFTAYIYGDVVFSLRSRAERPTVDWRLCAFHISARDSCTLLGPRVFKKQQLCKKMSKEDERSSGEDLFEVRRQDHRKSMFNNEWLPPIRIQRFFPLILYYPRVRSSRKRDGYRTVLRP